MDAITREEMLSYASEATLSEVKLCNTIPGINEPEAVVTSGADE